MFQSKEMASFALQVESLNLPLNGKNSNLDFSNWNPKIEIRLKSCLSGYTELYIHEDLDLIKHIRLILSIKYPVHI